MSFFIVHLVAWIAVDIMFDPGVIEIKIGKAPTVKYDRNNKSWAVPAYDLTKKQIIKAERCLRYESTPCLRSN